MKNIFGLKRSYAYKRRNWGCLISRTVIVIAFFLFVSGFVFNQIVVAQNEPQIKVGENSGLIKSGNQTRHYLLYIPEGYDGKTNLPLVFLFHGLGHTGEHVMNTTDLIKVADKKKFIIAAPEGIYPHHGGNGWNAGHDPRGVNDVELVKDLIREISSKVAIDKKRIYATGFSNGAWMSSHLACELSNVIAAIGPVAGLTCYVTCTPTRPVPVISFHGTLDQIITTYSAESAVSGWVEKNGCNKTPATRKISEDVTQTSYGGCKGNAEVVFYLINDGGHTWPDSPIADFYDKFGFGKTNKDINASNLIWSFFEAHPLP
jgi:polyhydroxybutyrate depolymerase